MKHFFILFALVAVVLAVYPFLDESENTAKVSGLPWQIEMLADGSTQVFGLTIGQSRFSDALAILGNDMQMAIIAANDEAGNLEMYYGHYKAGLLSGKLILQTGADEKSIKRWRDNAVKAEYMATGLAKKYTLSDADQTEILTETITGITFIPAVNLDEEVVIARFGKPASKIQTSDGQNTVVTHFLYPEKGLHIALSASEKEVLQYVLPAQFGEFMAPLKLEVSD